MQVGSSAAPEGGYTGTGITGTPVGFNATGIEVGTLIQTSQIEMTERIDESALSSASSPSENTFTYVDAKLVILGEFRTLIRADLSRRNKDWSGINNRRKRRYTERAKESIVMLVTYQDMVDKFPNIVGYVDRLQPKDF